MKVQFDKQKIFDVIFRKQLSIAQIAKDANISITATRRAVAGKMIHIKTAAKICDALSINADFFAQC